MSELAGSKEAVRDTAAAAWLLRDNRLSDLEAVIGWVRQFEQPAPSRPYEEFFQRAEGLTPFEGRLLSDVLRQLGKRNQNALKAERHLASIIFEIDHAEAGNLLVISRRARKLAALIQNEPGELALSKILTGLKVPLRAASVVAIVTRASAKDPEACVRLLELCRLLKPHARPHGRPVTEASATHELLLAGTGRGYSSGVPDKATKATRDAFKERRFSPRPAFKRLKPGRLEEAPEGTRSIPESWPT